MVDLGFGAWSADDGDDIEPDFLADMLQFDIVVDGLYQVLLLMPVDSLFRLTEEPVTAGLHFDKHHDVAVKSDDVNIPAA